MRWILKKYNPIISDAIAQNFSLDPISAILLAQRAGEEYESWINVKRTVPNPKALPDIDQAITAIKQAKYIGIFSDYDADGVTSAVMWQEFLCARDIKTTTYIPNRKVGYGPTQESIQELIARGVDTLLFLDCGTDCHELFTNIKIPIVVIDHHLVKNPSLPVAAFVNPYRTNVTQFLNLCTAALSLLVIAAIDSKYPSKRLYDLAAIGTISDMNAQIATASEQQTAVTEEISRSITSIADSAEETDQGTRETAQTSQQLHELAEQLRTQVARFKV